MNQNSKTQNKPPPPKKPLPPFFLYRQEVYDQVKQKNPNAKMTDLSKIISQMWGKADQATKDRLEEQYQKNKQQVAKAKQQYENQYGKIQRKGWGKHDLFQTKDSTNMNPKTSICNQFEFNNQSRKLAVSESKLFAYSPDSDKDYAQNQEKQRQLEKCIQKTEGVLTVVQEHLEQLKKHKKSFEIRQQQNAANSSIDKSTKIRLKELIIKQNNLLQKCYQKLSEKDQEIVRLKDIIKRQRDSYRINSYQKQERLQGYENSLCLNEAYEEYEIEIQKIKRCLEILEIQ